MPIPNYFYRFEEEIALPRPLPGRGSETLDEVAKSATVSAIVVCAIPSQILEPVLLSIEPPITSPESWAFQLTYGQGSVNNKWYIGVLPVEAKCHKEDQAFRQLSMYLSAIQHQRRALCLCDRIVYGGTLVNNIFKLFVSLRSERGDRIVSVRLVDPRSKIPYLILSWCMHYQRATTGTCGFLVN